MPRPDTGLTKYRVACEPRDSIPLGSCTASSPSRGAMEAAQRVLDRFREAADPIAAVEAEMAAQRQQLAALFELDEDWTLPQMPSGTDAIYLVSVLARSMGESDRVHHVVVGASELGGGTVRAARGLGISDVAPFGESVTGEPVEGLAGWCTAEPFYLRDEEGNRLEPSRVDERVAERVLHAAHEGVTVVLHLVAHSKTGLRSPSAAVCARLKQELGDRLLVLVDGAQGRLAPRDVRRALDLDFVVLFTGSKFYSGPPFSSILVLPTALSGDPGPLPSGLSAWFARAELPAHWEQARESLREPVNIGLALRWAAALYEIEAYHDIPPRHRASAYHTFAGAVYGAFGPSKVLEIDVPVPPVHQLVTALGAYPSVFGFAVHGPDGLLGADALRRLHALLDTDLGDEDPALAGQFHLGQPVALGPPGPDQPALLRVALGARLATEHANTDDCGALFFHQTMTAVRRKLEALVARRAWEQG